MAAHLTNSQIALIKELRRKNEPIRNIATQIGCSAATVQYHSKKVRRKFVVTPETQDKSSDQKALFDLVLRSSLESSQKVRILQELV